MFSRALYGHARAQTPDQTNKQICICVSNTEKVRNILQKNKKRGKI